MHLYIILVSRCISGLLYNFAPFDKTISLALITGHLITNVQAALPGRLEDCQGEDCTRRRLELEVSLHRAGEELERGQARLKQLEVAAKQGRERLEQIRSQVSRGNKVSLTSTAVRYLTRV